MECKPYTDAQRIVMMGAFSMLPSVQFSRHWGFTFDLMNCPAKTRQSVVDAFAQLRTGLKKISMYSAGIDTNSQACYEHFVVAHVKGGDAYPLSENASWPPVDDYVRNLVGMALKPWTGTRLPSDRIPLFLIGLLVFAPSTVLIFKGFLLATVSILIGMVLMSIIPASMFLHHRRRIRMLVALNELKYYATDTTVAKPAQPAPASVPNGATQM